MSLLERTRSRENDRPALRHRGSMESVKSVPMWDSSDPERAPPPLPLNPNLNQSPTRANASATVEAAARALTERARASAASPYSFSSAMDRSPEKSPTRTPQNKRLQNVQNGGLKENRVLFDNTKATDWLHTSRPTTPTGARDVYNSSPERSPSRADSLARTDSQRTEKDLFGATPNLRHGARPPIRPILSESPRSPTMLAIQNMAHRDTESSPTRDISATSKVTTSYPVPSNLEAIYTQMQNLTNIATTLQKDMSALSRRSKDNATDLISLKEATNSRDEDIRKTLHELVTRVKTSDHPLLHAATAPRTSSRPASIFAGHSPSYLDNKPYTSPPMAKSASLPRLDYGMDLERAVSPYSVDGAASVAMLEKIIRDMVTKEGQEHFLSTLRELLDKVNHESNSTAKKVAEILDSVHQTSSQERALVRHEGQANDQRGQAEPPDVMSGDLKELLQRIKDSVSQSGGMTGEVKNLVRELRGEVLGMGRDLGHKLETLPLTSSTPGEEQANRDVMVNIVQESLAELKQQIEDAVRSNRRQSTGSVATLDTSSVYSIVKHALAEHAAEGQVNQEAILTAVREAYEAYKPEIELQQFGLERDEILQCLKEGLDDYRATKSTTTSNVTRDEILEAVNEALQTFQPPTAPSDAFQMKEELLTTVRECLEEHATHSGQRNTEAALTSEQVVEAMRIALGESRASADEDVLHSLHDILAGMRGELQQYSASSSDQNDHVLESINVGLDTLRGEMSTIAERGLPSMVADEVREAIAQELESIKTLLSTHLEAQSSVAPQAAFAQLTDLINAAMDKNHAAMAEHSSSTKDIVNSDTSGQLHDAIEQLRASIDSRGLDEPMEDIMQAIKADFDLLRDDILRGTASQGSEFFDKLQQTLDAINVNASEQSLDSGSSSAIIATIKEEFEVLKETMALSMMSVTNLDERRDTSSAITEALQDLRAQLASDQQDNAAASLGMLKEELQTLHGSLGNSSGSGAASGTNIELLEAIRDGLDGLRSYNARSELDDGVNDTLDCIRDDIEQIRESLRAKAASADTEEGGDVTLGHINNTLNDLKLKLDATGVGMANVDSADVVQALNNGIDAIKDDIAKMADKPIDMTTSYETLDLLKSGHAAILFEIERIRADLDKHAHDFDESLKQVVLADPNASADRSASAESGKVNKEALEKLEVMLAHLQIKIEAMDQNMQSASPTEGNAATLQAIANLEAMLEVLQATVAAGASRTQGGMASKEDTDAIEVLLLNTKAKLDDVLLPAVKSNVSKDDLDNVEALVRMTGESVDLLSTKLPNKDDLAKIEDMLEEVVKTVQDVQARTTTDSAQSQSSKDIAALQALCTTIQSRLDCLPSEGKVSGKADTEQLAEQVQDLQKSLEKLHELHEEDIEVTAKAFDDRKTESQGVLNQIAELKVLIDASKDDIKSRMKRGNQDVRALDEILQAIEQKMEDAPNAVPIVETLSELVKEEFDRTKTSLETLTSNLDAKSSALLQKHEDLDASITSNLATKLDNGLAEHRSAVSQAADSVERLSKDLASRAQQQEMLLTESKALSDELRLTIDTLGASVTGISPALADATEKMADDSRVVFNKIEQIQAKLDTDHADTKDEHELTRTHLAKSLSALSLLREQLSQDHPKVMEAVASVLAVVSQHFEHSRKYASSEQSKSTAQSDSSAITPAAAGTYSEAQLGGKLDEILQHAVASTKTSANLEKLNEIHQQVMSTAAEVSAFVAFQTKMIATVHDTKEEEAKEAAVNLSKAVAETQQLQSKMINLQAAKDDLAGDIEALMTERDALTSQKMRLTAEVSSLNTALEIRREELELMDARADALHRRIVDGVMNQSRALLMAKPKKKAMMNLKRVNSNTSRITDATTTPSALVSTGVGMALHEKPSHRKQGVPLSAGGRRIVSLGLTSGNASPGVQRMSMSRNVTTGPVSLKRVQSIKNQRLRHSASMHDQHFDDDKENGSDYSSVRDLKQQVNPTYAAGSTRSVSYAGSHASQSPSRRSVSYGTYGSEYSVGTGSYLTGSDVSDRRTSYGFSEANTERRDRHSVGSTIRSSRIGASEYAESTSEEDEEEGGHDVDADVTPPASPNPERKDANDEQAGQSYIAVEQKQQRHGDSDSGLGSDLPTAALSAQDFAGYFPEKQQSLVES